ncbi:MAG: hypothetical protein ACLPSW_30295 [Roseiarcus sp.]
MEATHEKVLADPGFARDEKRYFPFLKSRGSLQSRFEDRIRPIDRRFRGPRHGRRLFARRQAPRQRRGVDFSLAFAMNLDAQRSSEIRLRDHPATQAQKLGKIDFHEAGDRFAYNLRVRGDANQIEHRLVRA